MVFKISYLLSAQKDIDEAIEWYELQRKSLGALFLDKINATEKIIQNNPLQFQKVYKNIHRANLIIFPFNIFYHVQNETVIVIAVLHQKRNPGTWKKRIR